MTSITSILAATDFSIDGNNAVRRAALLAQQHGARLHILHVVQAEGCRPLREWFTPTTDIDLKAAQARTALRRVAVEIAAACDVAARVEVAVGDPLETLLQAARHAALVVVGQRGHSRLDSLLIGGTADRLLRLSPRPVLVVKTPGTVPYRRVLMPIDFTAASDAAVRFAAPLVRPARLHVFHAADTHHESLLRRSDVSESVIHDVLAREDIGTGARMRRRLARLGLEGTSVSFAVGRGQAVHATLRHATAIGADLIVAGRQGRSTLGEFLLGSVSGRVLAESGCDVLIVGPARGVGAAAGPGLALAGPGREAVAAAEAARYGAAGGAG